MAIIASLFALVGRFVGKILTTALGWSSLLLFGRVPQSKQVLLAAITFGSLAWVLTVFGVIAPRVGAYLIAAIPAPSWVQTSWIRLAMLAAAILIPIAIGIASRFMLEPGDRPSGRTAVVSILRGYPFAAVLSFVLVFVSVVAAVRRVRSLLKRWQDAHVPVIVRSGGYERVVRDLHAALGEAGLVVERSTAPRVLEIPARLLGVVAGRGVRSLVPTRLALLRKDGLEILVYPSDIAISGAGEDVARSRAAIASRVTFTAAYLTTTRESQAVEDLIEEAAGVREGAIDTGEGAGASGIVTPDLQHTEAVLAQVDRRLDVLDVPYDDWEVLYRMRLQVERDALRAAETPRRDARVRVRDGRRRRAGTRVGDAPGRRVETRVGDAFSLGVVALLALDVLLGIADRVPRRSRRRLFR